MNRRYPLFILLLILAVFFAQISLPCTEAIAAGETSYVSDGDGSSESEESDKEEPEEEEEEEGPNWIMLAFQKLAEFLTDIALTLWKAFTKLIGFLLDDLLKLFQNAFASAFIYTEPFSPDSWVKKWWSITLLILLSISGVAILSTVYKSFFALSNSEDSKGLEAFKPIALGLVLSFFAFFIVRWGTDVQNNVWQETLSPAIQSTCGAGGISWDGELSTVRADMVLKAMLTGGNMSGIDVNELDTMGISKVLYDPDSDRGSFSMMVIVMICLILIAFAAILHIWVLALALVASPLYMGIGALKGNMDPISGIWNIILRSLFLQSLFGAYFLFVSDIRSEGELGLGGASPDLITLILTFVLAVLIHFFYIKEVVQAIKSPGDLGGAKVIAGTGKVTAVIAGGVAGLASAVGLGGQALANSDREGKWGQIERGFGRGIEKTAGWSEAGARSIQKGGQRLEKDGVNAIPGAIKDGYGVMRSSIHDSVANRVQQKLADNKQDPTMVFEKINEPFDKVNKPSSHVVADRESLMSSPESLKYTDIAPERSSPGMLTYSDIIHDDLEGYQGFQIHSSIRERVMQVMEENTDNVPMEACVWNLEGTQMWVHPSYAGETENILNSVAQEVQPVQYWKKGDGFIVLNESIPVKVKTPPVDGVYMGEW